MRSTSPRSFAALASRAGREAKTRLPPVAEVRPINIDHSTVDEHVEGLAKRGVAVRRGGPRAFLSPLTRRPGALQRFLIERDG